MFKIPESIAEEYQRGFGLLNLARKYGCSTTAVRNFLLRKGIPLREPHRPKVPDWAAEEYKNGASLRSLAQKYGCSHEAVRKHLISKEVALRNPGRDG